MNDIEQQLPEENLEPVSESQDIPTEPDVADNKEEQSNPMPMAVKLFMLCLVVFVIVAVTITIKFVSKKGDNAVTETAENTKQIQTSAPDTSSNDNNEENKEAGSNIDFLINNPKQPPKVKIEEELADKTSINQKIYAEEIANNVANNVRQEFSKTLESQNKEILSLRKQLQKLEGNIETIQGSIANTDNTTLTKISALNDSIKLLSDQITLMEKRLNESAVKSNIDTAAAIKRIHDLEEKFKSDPAAPPFELLSVDEWGTEKQAVLELDGHTTVAAKGEIRAGWQIVSLSSTEIECQRLKDGRRYVLKRKGGA